MAGLADAHLAERVRELLGERSFHVLRQLGDRSVECETRLDRDGEQIERIRQLGTQLVTRANERGASTTKPGGMNPNVARPNASRRPMVPPSRATPKTKPDTPPTIAPTPCAARNVVGGDRPAHAGGEEPDEMPRESRAGSDAARSVRGTPPPAQAPAGGSGGDRGRGGDTHPAVGGGPADRPVAFAARARDDLADEISGNGEKDDGEDE